MITRYLLDILKRGLEHSSAVAILGPRQVGKTTLAQSLAKEYPSIYLDLESPKDLRKLDDPLSFLPLHEDKLVILDEIHRCPEIFTVLRGLIDKKRQAGSKKAQFLILGSASRDLLKQSAESLAGRISYFHLTGFNALEIPTGGENMQKLWVRGGFPESFLADGERLSFEWREDFIGTYLERDIPQMGFRVPMERLRRLWIMLAHGHGQFFNASSLGAALDLNNKTVKHYLDILTELLLVRCLRPWHGNIKKRLVKSPRVYIRDSGILHNLIGISDYDNLLSHPVAGVSWEGFVMENILPILPKGAHAWFYRTAAGAEIDLVLQLFNRDVWAIEIKKSSSPKISRHFHQACADVKATKKYVVYTGSERYPAKHGTIVLGLLEMMRELQKYS